jgi:hypothetical protein
MPHFELFDLLKWLHFICVVIGGGAAVVAVLLSGLEDEREELRGVAPTLWKLVVNWAFRFALATGAILLALKLLRGLHPFDAYYLHVKLVLVLLLVAMAEMSPKVLAKAKRGAPLLALLLFLLSTFVVINKDAFGRRVPPPAEVSAGPAS